MKKILNRLFMLTCCVIFLLMFGVLLEGVTVHAAENSNPLLEGLSIVGPDYTFEYKGDISFTLKKDGEEDNSYMEQSKYDSLHYTWSSDDENVAKFQWTNYVGPIKGCIGMPYPVLERQNYFKINSGTTVIYCTISDDEGNSVVLSKKLTVLKETPIKALQFGKYKFGKEDLNTDYGRIYTNDIAKNVKINVDLEDGWKLKSQNFASIDTNNDYTIDVIVENEKKGWEFCYQLFINRYILHKISLKNLKPGCAFVKRAPTTHLEIRYYAIIIEYNKNSQPNDSETFKDGNDLVRKLIKYYGYDSSFVEYKNGELIYKETSSLKPWTYCTTKEELHNAIEDAKARNDFLRGLSIVGPDYVYGIEDFAKFHLAKDGKSDKKMSKNYEGFKFQWSSDNKRIAKIKKLEKKTPKKKSYPILKRQSVFKVKPGIVYIHCKITDEDGDSVTMIKKVTVLDGRPIKSLKIGSAKVKKTELKSTKCKRTICTNKKKAKIKLNLVKGWSVKSVRLGSGRNAKDITKKKQVYLNSKKAQKVRIVLENKMNGQTFKYECKVKKI